MFKARGYYHRTWTGKATGYLPQQTLLIAAGFPEFRDYYPATVNVRFEPQIIVTRSDHNTGPIDWRSPKPPEVFDLTRCWLTFERLGLRVKSLAYTSHGSIHRLNAHRHEFLVERFIDGMTHGDSVIWECDRPFVRLPYAETEADADGLGPRLAETMVIL